MSRKELLLKWNTAREKLQEAEKAVIDLQTTIQPLREEYIKMLDELKIPAIPSLDQKRLEEFFKQPYLLLPRKGNTWYVIVPRFIDMQLGWLEYQTPSFNVFVINKYVRWLTPRPSEIEERLRPAPRE